MEQGTRRGSRVRMIKSFCMAAALGLALAGCAADSSVRLADATATASPASAPPQTIAFAGTAHEVAIEASIGDERATFLVDTGVDPSALDLAVARAHGLRPSGESGPVDGVGNDAVTAYPVMLDDLRIGERGYGPLEALVLDMSGLSARYGAPLAGILGYSLLRDHAVLIDYPAGRITLFDGAATQEPQNCARVHRFALQFLADDDHLIMVPGLTIAGKEIAAFIDTGSTNGLRIDLDDPAVAEIADVLPEGRESTSMGARGTAVQELAALSEPVTLGPLMLDAADVAMVHGASMPIGIGNRFFEALGARLLVDIPAGRVAIFQNCD